MDPTMELPDDVLQLIREYSRPRFKYFREYKRMLRLYSFQEWSALRDALQLNPERVLPSLLAHEKAQTIWLQAYHEVLDRKEKIRRGYYGKQYARSRTYSELVNTLSSIT
jgi:hypothetical protein